MHVDKGHLVANVRKVKKELFYKKASFQNPTRSTLQELVSNARSKHSDAEERELDVGGTTLVWNNHTIRAKFDLGMLHSFEKGRSQLILATASSVKEYQIMASPPPVSAVAGEKLEFNEGLLFFGIHKNHVIVLQSAALKVSKLAEYLNWLLRKSGQFSTGDRVEFVDPTPVDLRKKGAPPLKSIRVTSPFLIEREQTAIQPNAKKREKKKDMRFRVDKATWNPIQSFLESVGAKVPESLRFDGNFNPGLLELSIEFKWKGKKKDRDNTPVLDSILHSFQDMDNPPIEAETATGEKISGNDLRTRKPVLVDVQGKIPVYTDVYSKMQDYLAELLKSGQIDVS